VPGVVARCLGLRPMASCTRGWCGTPPAAPPTGAAPAAAAFAAAAAMSWACFLSSGRVHDPGIGELNVYEQHRNVATAGQVVLGIFSSELTYPPDGHIHVVAVDSELFKPRVSEGQGLLQSWTAQFKRCIQLLAKDVFLTSEPTLWAARVPANQIMLALTSLAAGMTHTESKGSCKH
jgi:hypothetical protein